jgi:hypothetical protein
LVRSALLYRGRILGHNWDKNLKAFPSCYSQSPYWRILLPTFGFLGFEIFRGIYFTAQLAYAQIFNDYTELFLLLLGYFLPLLIC